MAEGDSADRSRPSLQDVRQPPTRAADGPYRPTRDPTVLVLVAIVLGAILFMILGVGTSLTGGPGGGPVFPIGDGGGGQLELSANRTTVSPGDPVAVRVTEGGDPLENATVTVAEETYRTGEDGRVVVVLERGGNYSVTARPPGADTDATVGTAASLDLTVERRRVVLAVATNRTTLPLDGAVRVRITVADNGSPVGGVLAIGDREVRTGPNGTATVRVRRGGTVTVRATREPARTVRFEPDEQELRVRRPTTALALSLSNGTVRSGEAITATVVRRDTGEPVAATVSVGGRTLATGEDGLVTVALEAAGSYDVTAERAPTARRVYRNATAGLTVRRRIVDLVVSLSADRVGPGEAVEVTVRRSDTGNRTAARIAVGDRVLRTGADGRATVSLDRPVRTHVVASRANTSGETFRNASSRLHVAGTDFVVTGLSAPPTAAAGLEIAVNVTLRNDGTVDGAERVRIGFLGGQPLATEPVALDRNETRSVTVRVRLPERAAGIRLLRVRTERGTAVTAVLVFGGEAGVAGPTAEGRIAGDSYRIRKTYT